MKDDNKTKKQLIKELAALRQRLRQRLAEWETSAAERRQVQDVLQQSEERYKQLLDSVTDYIYTVQVEAGRPVATFHSPACVAVTGYTAEEYEADRHLWYRMIYEDDRQIVTEQIAKVLAGEVVPSLEHRLIHKDGSTRWVSNMMLLRYNELGHLISYDGLVSDITERKQAEEALAEERNLLRTLIDNLPDYIYVKDVESRFVVNNIAHVHVLGATTPAEVIGKTDLDLFPRELAEQYYVDERAVINSGQAILDQEEIVEDQRTGNRIWVSVTKVPLRDQQGNVTGLVGISRDITARKQAEEALQESEQMYRDLFNNSLSGIALHEIITDDEGQPIDYIFLEVNRAFEKLTGLSAEDVVGRRVTEVLPGIRDDPFIEIYGRVALTGESVRFEQFATPLNRHFEIAAFSPRKDQFAAVFTDITARKQAEEELYRRNRELELLNRIIAASATTPSVKPEEILEIACRELAQTFDVPQAAAALLNEQKTEAVVVAEYRTGDRPSGLNTTIPVVDNPSFQHLLNYRAPLVVDNAQNDPRLAPIHDLMRRRGAVSLLLLPLIVGGKVVGSLGLDAIEPRHFTADEINLAWSVADQVAGALARAQINAARRLLSAAIEQTTEGVVIFNPDRTIRYVNPAFEQMTGYSRAEAIGQELDLLRSGKHNPAFYEEMWATVSTGKVWQGRIINRKKDGTLYTDETVLAPVRNEQGETINYVELKRDVTHALQLEKQYRRAQRMEAVGRLTGGIAHDFNNLLTVINGFAELLQLRLPSNSPYQKLVDNIVSSGQSAANLIGQLMAFSRKQIIEPEVLNLNTVVTELDKMLRRIIGEDIELESVLAPDLWPVKVDPSQIEQVIVNLAVNARDAMPRGGRLTIETANVVLDEAYVAGHLEARPGGHVLLIISDTGMGMSHDVQAHIFEPFFTTKEQGKGTGLGLATVYGIVKQSGGDIQVYSEQGIGTTFKIYLPKVEAGTTVSTQDEQPDDLPQGTETVLIVEDDARVRELAIDILDEQGYTVLEAGNGEEAWSLLQAYDGEIHLLLTDVIMPRLGGRELADRLKAEYPQIKVLFTSGYTDDAIVNHGVLESGVAFIQKPYSVTVLARKVREVLDKV